MRVTLDAVHDIKPTFSPLTSLPGPGPLTPQFSSSPDCAKAGSSTPIWEAYLCFIYRLAWVSSVSLMGCTSSKSQTTRDHELSNLPRTNPERNRNGSGTKYVGVVGRTGSGLSQFIHDVTGKYESGVAHEATLHPCTLSITPITFRSPFGTIVLIDTPGFDYSDRNNEYITFDKLGGWFKNEYGPHAKLDGIIYMHNIWNAEAYHRSPLLTCQPLEDLCGPDWRRKVMFVNSHWSERITNDSVEREERLRAGYWRFMLSRGSVMRRYESPGNKKQALQILQELLRPDIKNQFPLATIK